MKAAKSTKTTFQGEVPDYHSITVVTPTGESFLTRSTYGQLGDRLQLDIDPTTHPAWTGGEKRIIDRGGRVSRFNARYGSLALKKT